MADGYPFEGGLDLKYAIFDGIWGLITGKSPGAVSAQQSSVELDDRSATLHQRCEHTGNKDEAVHFHTHEPNEAYQALDGLTKITLVSPPVSLDEVLVSDRLGGCYDTATGFVFLVQISILIVSSIPATPMSCSPCGYSDRDGPA